MFSAEEKLDMYNIYIRCLRNSNRAAEIYLREFPERQQPHRTIFKRLAKNLQEHGTLQARHSGPYRKEINASEVNVLAQIHMDPRTSSRKIAIECGISDSRVRQIIKKHKFHDYKYKSVQTLYEGDSERRLTYCTWFRQQLHLDSCFSRKILWTDESSFTNAGIFNRKNCHYYATEHPHLVKEVRPQRRFSVNIWAGILNNVVLGPVFLDGVLNGDKYLDLLQINLEELLENISISNYVSLKLFQQDGCGPHNAGYVQNYLNCRFPNAWIGTVGPVKWPPRSPCLNPLDYFLWGYMKDMVYSTPVENVEHLRSKITDAFQAIQAEQIQRAVDQMPMRIQLCIEKNGGVFEHII